MSPPPSSSSKASRAASRRSSTSGPVSGRGHKETNRPAPPNATHSAESSATPVLPDFSSLVPHHLDVLEGLPTNLRYLYSKITDLQHELDAQLDHLHASTTAIHASIRDRILSTNYRPGVKVDIHMAANQAFSHLAGTTLQQCQRTAQRKVDLATYAYELVDRCVLKLDEELKAAGLPIQDAYPVILAAVANASGAPGTSSSSAPGVVAEAPLLRGASDPTGTETPEAVVLARSRGSRKRSRAPTPDAERPSVPTASVIAVSPGPVKKVDKKKKATGAVAAAPLSRKGSSNTNRKTHKRKSATRGAPTSDGEDEEEADEGSTSDAAAEHFSTPVDPNEPLYCTCQSVAHGEMVACDDADCPYEWFHYACVGLTKAPKGQWFCSECSLKRKRQKKH